MLSKFGDVRMCGFRDKRASRHMDKFLCMLPEAMALSHSGGIAIRYVLPVLRMKSNMCTQTKRERNSQNNSIDFNQILLNEKDEQVHVMGRAHRAKSVIYDGLAVLHCICY